MAALLNAGPPAVCFALQREAAPFLRTARHKQRVTGTPGPAWHVILKPGNHEAIVLVTGVGARRTAAALDWLFRHTSPSRLIAAGFAGGLRSGFRVGDVLRFAEVVDETGTVRGLTPPRTPAPFRLLTATRLISSPLEKRALSARFNADAVDMESATVARLCAERGVPLACVRALSDAADTPLSPSLVRLLAGGRVSPWRLTAALLRSPRLVVELIALARSTARAARNLAAELHQLLVQADAAAGAGEQRASSQSITTPPAATIGPSEKVQ